jgi:transposase-like protein
MSSKQSPEESKVEAVRQNTECGDSVSDVARFSSCPIGCPLINDPGNLR